MSSLDNLSPSQLSSRRKRPFAAITTSDSRSPSPSLPFKRRRTSLSSSTLTSSAPSAPALRRFVGGGIDYRRPAMPTMNNDPNTIDLTLDDDTPPPASRPPTETPDFFMPSPSPVPTQSSWHRSRAPPFNGPGSAAQPVVLVDPSDEDDGPHEARRAPAVHIRSPSPEVEFVRAQPAQANLRLPEPPAYPPAAREPYQVPQQPAGMAFGGIHDFMRRTTQYFGNFPNQILPNLGLPILGNLTPAEDDALEILEGPDVFGDVHLDYGQAAFRMRDRESEAPQAAQDDYKPPPDPLDGCLRTYEEESILVCPCCGEELCTGEGELKQQVWVNKTCGHVYCGECASNRVLYKHANKRDTRRVNHHKARDFRFCKVDGCKKAVTNKSSMFPIYL